MMAYDDELRRKVRYLSFLARRSRERRRLGYRAAVLCATLSAAMLIPAVKAYEGHASADGNARCTADMGWPLADPQVVRAFDGPSQPWLPGHRGVDLRAQEGTTLIAPVDGSIGFAGMVAGKSVVSIVHGDATLTFEPARTDLSIGMQVQRGKPFATVSHGSDHCDGSCVHWGMRRDARRYVDPAARTSARRIALKPTS